MYVLDTILLHKTENLANNVIPIKAEPVKCNSLVMVLFDECNLNCGFCMRQNKDSTYYFESPNKMSRESIMAQVEMVKKVKQAITDPRDLSISLVGGELFQDKYDYSVYDDLFDALVDIFCEHPEDKIQICIYSNFLFKDNKRVADLIERHKQHINFIFVLSFDFVGRYTKPYMIKRVMDNYMYLTRERDIDIVVALIAHKPNIDALINHDSEYLPQLEFWMNDTEYCKVQFGDYIDNGNPEFRSSADDLVRLYKFLIDHYPQCDSVRALLSNLRIEQDHSCNELWVSRNGVRRCCHDIGDRKIHCLNTFGCFGCEFYENCPAMCYQAYYRHEYCWKRVIYQYLLDKGYKRN